jgi:hypothetical protein
MPLLLDAGKEEIDVTRLNKAAGCRFYFMVG